MSQVKSEQPTRRDRARAATRVEILEAARAMVARGEQPLLRAVAREVGMTAPALYRYVDGHDDLMDLLGGALYDELIEQISRDRDVLPADDLVGRLGAMARSFRAWALAHRHEYGLLFANPLDAHPDGHTEQGCTSEGAMRFGTVFAEAYAQLWAAGRITPPDLDTVDPALLEAVAHKEMLGDLPVPLRYLFVRAWARLYGMVTLEAFGHLDWALDDGATLFEAGLVENLREMGVEPPA